MKHDTLAREIAVLKEKTANTPVSLYKGKYSHEGNLVMQVCAVGHITDEMAEVLVDTANLYGFGEHYNKIIKILESYKEYLERRHLVITTGCDWEDAHKPVKNKKEKPSGVGAGVFGRSWSQIEKMQGGKITLA